MQTHSGKGLHAWRCQRVIAWPPTCEDERDSRERWPCQPATCMVFELLASCSSCVP